MTGYPHATKELKQLTQRIWCDLFKEPTDTMGRTWSDVYGQLRDHCLTSTWSGVYDFVESSVPLSPLVCSRFPPQLTRNPLGGWEGTYAKGARTSIRKRS